MDDARLAKHSATVNMEGSSDAATPDSVVEQGLDFLARQAAKVVIGINPDISGHGVIPQDTNVCGGLSLQSAAPLKDLPGGVLASILKRVEFAPPPGITFGPPEDISPASLGELSPVATPGMDREQELSDGRVSLKSSSLTASGMGEG